MRRSGFPFACRLLPALLFFSAALFAQTDGVVGVPYTFDFGEGLKDIPIPPEISFTYSFTLSGGNLPPGLSLKTNGLLSGTPTTAGQFTFSVRWQFNISASGLSIPFDQSFPYTIVVTGSSGPKLSVQPGGLSFSFTAGGAAATEYISVNNQGDSPRDFSAAATITSGTNWLAVLGGGRIGPFGQGAAAVTVDPALLAPGTYVGSIAITFASGDERFDVPVVVSVSSAQQSLSLSQTGLTFRAVAGGAAPPAQLFSVLNAGGGALDWTVTTSTLSGGADWLTASPAGGRSDATGSPAIQVQVKPAGLAAGDYYGQVRIGAAGVANSPQSVSVVLTVAGSNVTLAPLVQPTGLIFVGQAGGANPAPQTVEITNLSSSAVNVSAGIFLEQGTGWLNATPKTGAVPSGQPLRIQAQPALAGLAAGVYRGELDILFIPGNATRRIDVVLIVTPAGSAPAKSDSLGPRLAGGCAPTKLIPVFTQLGSSFTTTAAWPTPVELRVVDDCGAAMTTGAVVLTFSTGDPLLAMTSLRDGRWTATWQARTATAAVTITAKAQQASPSLAGTASIGGSLQPNPTAPVIAAGGAVSAVSNTPLAPLAPGSLVRISGSNLAQGSNQASDLPLAKQLNGTQALLAGLAMPLQSASGGQIVAVVPYDAPINATQQMIVQRGTTYSMPEPVAIAAAQPAVFTTDPSGKGAVLASGIKPDGTQYVVDADNPVTAGDTLVISCAGLGAVDPPVDAGAAGPSSPMSQTVNPVTVTIGGVDAPVSSAVLAADLVGVYQVTVTVPDGIAPAPDAALVVTVAAQASPAVTIAVQ